MSSHDEAVEVSLSVKFARMRRKVMASVDSKRWMVRKRDDRSEQHIIKADLTAFRTTDTVELSC